VRQQFLQSLRRLRRQTFEHILQVRVRVHAQMLARGREAEEHSRGLASLVAPQKQPVDAAHADQLQRPLADVVVDVQVTIRRVPLQRLPLVEHVWVIRKVLQHNIERKCLSANWDYSTSCSVCSESFLSVRLLSLPDAL
jgi:hypothetical protein